MTKTYSEVRQDILFRAACDFYKLAAEIFEDTVRSGPPSENTLAWLSNAVWQTFKRGMELEDRGHEQCIASTRWENRLRKCRGLIDNARQEYYFGKELV